MYDILTLKQSKITMQTHPKTVSLTLIPEILLMIDVHISMKVLPLAVIPKRSLICDERIIKATALVNPEETGPDTKSIKNPSPNNPIKSSTVPERKQSTTAFCQLP